MMKNFDNFPYIIFLSIDGIHIHEKTTLASKPHQIRPVHNLILQTLQAIVSEHGQSWSPHERPIPTLLTWDGPLPLSVIYKNPMKK